MMKRTLNIILKITGVAAVAMATVLMMPGCDNKKSQYKEFAGKVAEYVNANRVDSLKAIYPSAEFDSIGFEKPVGEITVEDITEGTPVKVNYGNDAWLLVQGNPDGSFTIADSYGLAAFPEGIRAFAKATGIIGDGINDNDLKKGLEDEAFVEWLKDKTYEKVAGNIDFVTGKKVSHGSYYCEGANVTWPVTVTNKGSKPVKGTDYRIIFTERYPTCSDGSSPDGYQKRSKSGVDLEPGASKEIILSITCSADILNPALEFNISRDDYFRDNFKPNGTEYKEYLKAKQ